MRKYHIGPITTVQRLQNNWKSKMERTSIAPFNSLRFATIEEMGQFYGVKGALGPLFDQVGADVDGRHVVVSTFPDDCPDYTTSRLSLPSGN